MDPRFQQSAFIPKAPATQSPLKTHKPVNLFSLLSIVVFIISVGLTGGVFFLARIEANRVKEKTAKLEALNKDVKADGTIPDLLRLDTRIETAKRILGKHIALSQVLAVVEAVTSQNVQYATLDIGFKSNVPTIAVTGKARSLNSVAFQSDLLRSKNDQFANPIFSNLNLDAKGASFSVDVIVDSDVPLYKNKPEFAEVEETVPAAEGNQNVEEEANLFEN